MRADLHDLEELAIGYWPGEHVWHVHTDGLEMSLREWTWGERKRLLLAAQRNDGLDLDALCEGFVELLYQPAPPPTLAPLFTYVGLRLFRADGLAGGLTLAEAEQRLATELGLPPSRLDVERVSDLEHWVRTLSESGPAIPEPGWTRLEFGEGPRP